MNSQSIDPIVLSLAAKKLLQNPVKLREFSDRIYQLLQADLKQQALRNGRRY